MSIVVDAPVEGVVEQVTEPVEQATTEVVEETTEVQAEVQPNVPEKYAGKTLEEVIEMHQNVEKAFGKQGQEVGEQRKLIEQLLTSQQNVTTEPSVEETVSFEDRFYEDPAKAVESMIEGNPAIKQAQEMARKSEQKANLSQLEATHPDFMEVVGSEKFLKWVGDSAIRTELFRKANDSYDFNSANELIGTFKQLSMIDKTKQVEAEEKKKRAKAMRQTSSESRSSGDTVGGKKIYRRSDLINLQVNDPQRYAQLQPEIQLAYQEGRVK